MRVYYDLGGNCKPLESTMLYRS